MDRTGWLTGWVTPKVKPKRAGTQWMGYPTQQSNNRKTFKKEAPKEIWRPKNTKETKASKNPVKTGELT